MQAKIVSKEIFENLVDTIKTNADTASKIMLSKFRESSKQEYLDLYSYFLGIVMDCDTLEKCLIEDKDIK